MSPACKAAVTSDGLTVGCPKVYDSYYLHQQLNLLKAQLESIQAVSGASLPGSLGVVQGADVRQQSYSFQVMGSATPAVSSTSDSSGLSTTSTGSSLAPSAPTAAAGTLSPPTPGVGSLDRLAEAMQLQYQILNIQMLLDGSIDDKISPSGDPQRSLTLGFPISVAPPTSGEVKLRQDHVAIIRVRLCQLSPPNDGPGPSLITLLPKERTYNVAGITEKSLAVSAGGVLGGVLSVGGGFLNAHKRYYIVQDQETVALQDPQAGCSDTTPGSSFVWEVKPVLGNRQVRAGMQTNFVQLAYDGTTKLTDQRGLLDVCVEVSWANRRKSGSLDIVAPPDASKRCSRISRPEVAPKIDSLSVSNYAGSSLRVIAKGRFLPGTRVRIGNTFVNDANYRISDNNDSLEVNLAGGDLLAGDIALIGRDGDVTPLYVPEPDKAIPLGPIAEAHTIASDKTTHLFLQFELPKHANGSYFEETSCNPDLKQKDCQNNRNPWIVTIGDTIYGLSNAPITVCSEKSPVPHLPCGQGALDHGYRTIDLVVPTDSLTGDPQLTVRRLLWDPRYGLKSRKLNLDYPLIDKSVSLSSGSGIHLLLMGRNLDKLLVVYPTVCKGCVTSVKGDASLADFKLTKEQAADLKQVVFCKQVGVDEKGGAICGGGSPILLDITKEIPTPPTKASLKAASTTVGTSSVAFQGEKLETIVQISYAGQKLTYHITGDRLFVDLVPSIYNNVGVYPLRAKATDGTLLSTTVKVSSKTP